MKVRICNLTKRFGATLALDDVSFTFDSGHVFGFVGPNGAGKTTAMRIMATLEEPTSGDVYVNGSSVREQPEAVRRLLGYVPDSLPTHHDITVHEYLDFYGRAYGLRGAHLRASVEGVEEFANLVGIREKLIRHLSKGMKQRVSLGRALIFDPEVLVLDEPAAGLDPRARIELRELLGILAEQNKAILISSHILTELTEICNGVVIIEKGRILEQGTIEEVVQKQSLKRSMTMRALQPAPVIIKHLAQTAHVDNIREVAGSVHFDLAGEDAEACQVLAQLMGQGIQVIEYRETRENLEDIFMRVTRGGVQ